MDKERVSRGICQLRSLVNAKHVAFEGIPERFPCAFVECLGEVLDRFESRLEQETISRADEPTGLTKEA